MAKEFPDGDKVVDIIFWAKEQHNHFAPRWLFYELCLKYEIRFNSPTPASLYPLLWKQANE